MKHHLIIVLFILLSLCIQTAFAQVWDPAIQAEGGTSSAPLDPETTPFSENSFQTSPWLLEFTNVVVVNKANSGSDKQTLRLYVKGKLQLITKISSGREKFEGGCKAGEDPKKDHCSVRAYWSTTPVGYFDTDVLDQRYFSNLWQTWMPYSVFFESGIATHQAPAGTENKLGERASGGCIRMHPDKAPVLFSAVQAAGQGLVPVINRDGTLSKTAAGDTIRKISYKTLYIVQSIVKP